jgi:hypothetical protein
MEVERKTEELSFEQINEERDIGHGPVSALRDRTGAQAPCPRLWTRSAVRSPTSPHVEHDHVLPLSRAAETGNVCPCICLVGSGSPARASARASRCSRWRSTSRASHRTPPLTGCRCGYRARSHPSRSRRPPTSSKRCCGVSPTPTRTPACRGGHFPRENACPGKPTPS